MMNDNTYNDTRGDSTNRDRNPNDNGDRDGKPDGNGDCNGDCNGDRDDGTTHVDDPRLTAFALGELEGGESNDIAQQVQRSPELQRAVADIRETAGALTSALQGESVPALTPQQREALTIGIVDSRGLSTPGSAGEKSDQSRAREEADELRPDEDHSLTVAALFGSTSPQQGGALADATGSDEPAHEVWRLAHRITRRWYVPAAAAACLMMVVGALAIYSPDSRMRTEVLVDIKGGATSSRDYEADDDPGFSIPVHPLQFRSEHKPGDGVVGELGEFEWGAPIIANSPRTFREFEAGQSEVLADGSNGSDPARALADSFIRSLSEADASSIDEFIRGMSADQANAIVEHLSDPEIELILSRFATPNTFSSSAAQVDLQRRGGEKKPNRPADTGQSTVVVDLFDIGRAGTDPDRMVAAMRAPQGADASAIAVDLREFRIRIPLVELQTAGDDASMGTPVHPQQFADDWRGRSGNVRFAYGAYDLNITVDPGDSDEVSYGYQRPVGPREDALSIGSPPDPTTDLAGRYTMVVGGSMRSAEEIERQIAVQRAFSELVASGETQLPVETYDHIVENPFLLVANGNALSTFSIDVDTASYANVRRMLTSGMLPPAGAVRIEEMINYFDYDYPIPSDGHPFSVTVEIADCPWNGEHRLARIGLKGYEIEYDERPAANLVFLIDVSGSMASPDKLPLLTSALSMLVGELNRDDDVSIVVYAGASGMVLPATPGDDKGAIMSALGRLRSGGSTNGGAGIQLAYETALDNFIEGGINRVILATDGDFNVGVTSQSELITLIEDKARDNIFLSVLGFGMGNLKDSTLEKLADKGNGNYAYIDTQAEAQKVLVEQINGTLFTIAKDVKIQIEFNPAVVNGYRLIGYENRMMAAQDFNDDTKDAGEIGAGHTVTALYEIVPVGVDVDVPDVDPLKYQTPVEPSDVIESGEMMTIKLRYKEPDGDVSKLIELPIIDGGAALEESSDDFAFASSVAAFGMLLRGSQYIPDYTLSDVLELANSSAIDEDDTYRAEFLTLVERAMALRGE